MYFALLTVLTSACAQQVHDPARDGGGDIVTIAEHASDALRACAQKPRTASSIVAMVEVINALPRPVSIPCVIASLPRPLSVVAAQSFISAQPAFERQNPRLFIFEPGLVLSVVPVGTGAPLFEMGEWVTPLTTVKAELLMPVTSELSPSAPFDRVRDSPGRTTCGACHRHEVAHATIEGAYVSDAFRPADNALVPLSAVVAEHQACVDAVDGSERCELFHALFDFGLVEPGAFSPKVNQLQP